MGSISSKHTHPADSEPFVNTYILEEFGLKHFPFSQTYGLSAWDVLPDKNLQYYTGERFCRTPAVQRSFINAE